MLGIGPRRFGPSSAARDMLRSRMGDAIKPLLFRALATTLSSCLALACTPHDLPSLSKERQRADRLRPGQAVPGRPEAAVVGAIRDPITRSHPRFGSLVRCEHPSIVYKDEEGTGADRLMSAKLRRKLHLLATKVELEWPDVRLRITEAWDEDGEHGGRSIHYEGRAADMTTSDMDTGKLGRLAGLAIESGFDWVYFENSSHVHVSVRR
jgi:hypothetical protein